MTDQPPLPTYEFDGTIATITLDDGKANVFSSAVVAHLDGLLDRAEADQARALVIQGRPGKLSAGFNLAEMTANAESMRSLVIDGARWLLRLYGLPMPTVIACTGHALAAGGLLLLAGDVRIGGDGPAKIGLNEVAIGMTLPIFAVEMARDRLQETSVGSATMGAQIYDPAGAVTAGYLDQVVPADEVINAAREAATRLSELRTGAYAGTKTNLRGEKIAFILDGLVADMDGVDVPQL